MPAQLGLACAIVFTVVLLGVFAWLQDERPSRPDISDAERAIRWLYERLFLACLVAAMAVALLVLVPYLVVTELT